MPEIGKVNTSSSFYSPVMRSIPTDESVCGLLFDTSGFVDVFNGFQKIQSFFGDERTVLINNMDEAGKYGLLNERFMAGVVSYHISQFYDYVGKNAPLYICISDCSNGFGIIRSIQKNASGRIFQLGIWTAQSVFELNEGNDISVTSLIDSVQTGVGELCGGIGQQTISPTPLSILLSANTMLGGDQKIKLKSLPNLSYLHRPKISLLLAQDGCNKVRNVQNNTPQNAPAGCVGIALACLSLAGAEESIASVKDFNLNKNDNFQNPELGFGADYSPISDIGNNTLNYLSNKGYIVPVTYAGKDGECFFCSDSTLSNDDYFSISNNRIIHKCRRIAYSVMLQHANEDYELDLSTGKILASEANKMIDDVHSAIKALMINKKCQTQIYGAIMNFNTEKSDSEAGIIAFSLTISTLGYNSTITDEIIIE